MKIGFGKHKNVAIELLKITIDILNEFNINYFIISGTLLGFVRHNDFIPWDDDIDLMVDNTIILKINDINKKYNKTLTFINIENFLFKICFKSKVSKIPTKMYNKYLLNKTDTYNWPFIDIFIYYKSKGNNDELQLGFFNKLWNEENFFPLKQTIFNNININIPNNPDYFLSINYGKDYMTNFKRSTYSHRLEKHIN
jgi:phosphorylcholine metabolism protein LicD